MDLLIILTYVAFAWAMFKIFKIPVNKWTIPTAALGGIFIVSGLILLMNYNHPGNDSNLLIMFYVQIMPD
ncbi:hypothetical protein FSF17_023365, partial [Escherichia coli]|nr:hypothetical protein [Escherichia coli]